MKNIETISSKGIQKHFQLNNVVGKKVISENGEIIGKVKDVAFDLNKIVGIYIAGFLGFKKTLIDKEFIEHIHTNSIILKINPVTSLIGKIVFDKDGKKLGSVNEVLRTNSTNDFKEIIVKKNPISKGIKIPKKYMEVIAKNIILNKEM